MVYAREVTPKYGTWLIGRIEEGMITNKSVLRRTNIMGVVSYYVYTT